MSSALARFSLTGKVAIVTGASSGLGAGFARALADAGASVVLGARRADRLEAIEQELVDLGHQVATRETDVTDPEDCQALAAAAIDRFGRVDILVNNAGIGTAIPAIREAPADFRRVVETNLLGAFWMAQAAAQVMKPGSSIVNVSSVLALVKSFAPQAAYSASKAGVIGLTRDLSQQWAHRLGIRVNAVAPGYFESEMTESVPPHQLSDFLDHTCTLGRLGSQHELDAAIIFLASDASSYITGTTLAVDGGMSGH